MIGYRVCSRTSDFDVDVNLERHKGKEFVELIIWALSEKTCEDI